MPTIAREILSKDSSVDFEELEERETEVGRAQSTGTCKPRNLQVTFGGLTRYVQYV